MSAVPVERAPEDRWMVLIGALQIQMILGVVYGFSALVEPLKQQFVGWTHQDIQLANQLALLFFALTMVPAGRLQDKLGPRLPALLGAQALFLAFLLASTIRNPDQKMLWWISYGVLYGVGIGLAYVCPIAALVKWFPEKKGLITGVAVAGFGGGAAIFIPTVSGYLDPAAGNNSISDFFLIHALVSGVLVAIGALLLKNPPPLPVEQPVGATATPLVVSGDIDWRAMISTPRFWLLWGMFLGSATAGLMTIAVVKVAVGDADGISAAQAATAASVLSLCNAIGRIFWGAISDKLGRERTMVVMFGLQAVAMFIIPLALGMGAGAAILLMGLIGLNFGGNFALFPSATADAFGTRNLGVNYGCVFTAYGVAGFIGPKIAAYYKDEVGAYLPAFLIAGILVAVSAGAAVFSALLVGRKPAGTVAD